MARISAVIITLNEEKNISRCIDSLKGIADEIMVIDSSSTDRTRELAERGGAKVIITEWRGFVETKNKAYESASSDYILSLDADEVLSEKLAEEIRKNKASLSGAYSFNRLNNYCGKWIRHGGFYPDRKVRLFPKNAARWTGGSVHEKLELNPGTPVTHLAGDLLHYSYNSISEHLMRADRYSTLAAEIIQGSKAGLIMRMIFNSGWRFFSTYFLKLGILDGFYGYCICTITSWEVFLKYSKSIERMVKEKAS